MSVHGVNVVNPGPGGVWVFGIASVGRDFKVIHVAVGRGVDVPVKALEHGTFGFSLDDAFNDKCNVLLTGVIAIDVSLSEEFVAMTIRLINNFTEGTFGFPEVAVPVHGGIESIDRGRGIIYLNLLEHLTDFIG